MKIFVPFIIAVSFCLYSCPDKSVKTTPQYVIKKYEGFVLEMKPDSICQLLTMDAEIGHNDKISARGRDSIYNFLASFKNVRVINNRDNISNVIVKNDSAIVNGDYYQKVIINGKDTLSVSGKFTADMIRDKNNHWLICRMRTKN